METLKRLIGSLRRFWNKGILFLMLVGMAAFIAGNAKAAISNFKLANLRIY